MFWQVWLLPHHALEFLHITSFFAPELLGMHSRCSKWSVSRLTWVGSSPDSEHCCHVDISLLQSITTGANFWQLISVSCDCFPSWVSNDHRKICLKVDCLDLCAASCIYKSKDASKCWELHIQVRWSAITRPNIIRLFWHIWVKLSKMLVVIL